MHDAPPPGSSKEPPPPAQPYLEWALATDFAYLREGNWIPLLIEFDAKESRERAGNGIPNALEAFATRRWLADDPPSLDDEFIIPELFTEPPAALRKDLDFNFCIGLIRRDVNVVGRLVRSSGWNRTVRRLEIGPPVDFNANAKAAKGSAGDPSTGVPSKDSVSDATEVVAPARMGRFSRLWNLIKPRFGGSPPGAPPGSGGSAGPLTQVGGVVIAVIDQGFAFANSRFFNGNQPRIEYLWEQNMQTAMPPPGLTMPFTPGFELDKTAIINAMATAQAAGADEEWIYRVYGGLSFTGDSYKPLARRRTHGTHVLDLAAEGTDPAKHPIILVDMPEDAVGDPAGSTLSVQAAWGLIYVLDRTERLRNASASKVLPVVVNLSYGPHEGPHDGTAVLEVFMDKIWQLADRSDTPLEIVLAAGNSRQTRTHAAFDLRAGVRKNLRWRLQPGSLSASLMEIWLPPGGGHNVTVTLTPPFTSAALQPISVSPTNPGPLPGGGALYQAEYVAALPPMTADSIVLSIARTAPDPAGGWGSAVAPSGLWSVTLSSIDPVQGVNAWIKRSDTLSGRRAKGRQSYFDDRNCPRFGLNGRPLDYDLPSSSYMKRLGTLSGIATGRRTRIIGGHRSSDIYPARYSSHGTRTTAVAPAQGPDWLECCEESDVLRGVLGSGTHSGSTVRMNGTSVAAPQATRFLAEEWLATGTRPNLPPGLFVPLPLANRPIPLVERPAALSNGLAPSRLPQPPLR